MKINKYFDIHFERADDATIAKRLIGGAKIKGPALVTLILSIFIASIEYEQYGSCYWCYAYIAVDGTYFSNWFWIRYA